MKKLFLLSLLFFTSQICSMEIMPKEMIAYVLDNINIKGKYLRQDIAEYLKLQLVCKSWKFIINPLFILLKTVVSSSQYEKDNMLELANKKKKVEYINLLLEYGAKKKALPIKTSYFVPPLFHIYDFP
jgi:hypothetical protein